MRAPLAFRLFAVASLVLTSALDAQIETFYFDKQKVYRVDAVIADEILMEEIDPSAVSEYQGRRSDAWWVRGELPLDASYASAFGYYEIKRLPRPFKEREETTCYHVEIPLPREIPDKIEEKGGWNAFVVVAWLFEGELSQFQVLDSNKVGNKGGLLEFEIAEGKSMGLPLAWVVRNGEVLKKTSRDPWDIAIFEEGIAVGKEIEDFADSAGRTALHYAAANGLDGFASDLIGASRKLVRQSDANGYSPVWYAAQNGRSTMVALLEEAGAPEKEGVHDEQVLAHAAKMGHLETVAVLAPEKAKGRAQREAYNWALAQAVSGYFSDISFYLLERGAKFQVADEYQGKWVLKLFADGYPELAFRLMDELDVKSEYQTDGYGMLHAVATYADVDLLDQVAKRGPAFDLMTDKGLLPADYAIGFGNVDAICWFYDNARDSIRRKEGMNPLTYAIKEGQIDSVECLIGYGADVNEAVGPDITPVMFATFIGKLDIAELLVENGAIWLVDSKYMDGIVSKLIAADRSDLLSSVIETGWTQDRLIYETFSFEEAARFLKSDQTLERLEAMGWTMEGKEIPKLSQVTRKPVLRNGLNVHYPLELQEQFGERTITVSIAMTDTGEPALAAADLKPEEEALRGLVEDAVLGLRFEPAAIDEVPSKVGMSVKVPLFVEFDPEAVFELADVQEKPRAIRLATPLYPYAMQALRRPGRVVVEFIILADGSVRRLEVFKSSYEAFNDPALACVRNSTWEPAKLNGNPVACKVRMPIDFRP